MAREDVEVGVEHLLEGSRCRSPVSQSSSGSRGVRVMGVLLALGVVFLLAAIWQVFVHPLRALRAVTRVVCGVGGILLMGAAVGGFIMDRPVLAVANIVVGVVLLWC